MTKIDDDDLNFLNEIEDEDPKRIKKDGDPNVGKEKLFKQFSDLTGLLVYGANNTPVIAPKILDVFQAHKITKDNKEAQLLRELTNVENKIRDACFDRDTEVTCNNLFPETVNELRSRGFNITEIPARFLDDPFAWYRSESAHKIVRYVISWKPEDIVN